jgi:hypothetical protein
MRPIATPKYCFLNTLILKNNTPKMSVSKGVKALSMAATADSICCWAKAKRKAGKKVPTYPVMASHFQ